MRVILKIAVLLMSCFVLSNVAHAEDGGDDFDPGGDLNPEEMTINSTMNAIRRGKTSMMNCAMGYYMTKKGSHGIAAEVFDACAEAGYTAAMTWRSQLYDNAQGSAEEPEIAAALDKEAADAGDPVGQFNYGLDLLRGRGVARNENLGRKFIDQAADRGLQAAEYLRQNSYDWEKVTPDADEWKYQPKAF